MERRGLMVIDYQNDFVDPKGSLYVTGAELLLARINALITFARSKGLVIIFTRDWHPPVTTHFNHWPVHCVANTWGAEFFPGLDVRPGDIIISKATKPDEDSYSAFGDTSFVEDDGRHPTTVLHELGIERLESCGVATDYCDKDSNIGAAKAGFRVHALLDCMAAVNIAKGDGERAIVEMLNNNVRVDTARNLMRFS